MAINYLRPMGNNWFRFRQFMVHQKSSAMKVTTDACLFGALQPELPMGGQDKKVLDIGTGTGLLSLMTAQKNPGCFITALEIEESAAVEAGENFAGSPFYNRLQVIQQDVLSYETSMEFDLIICNPPFHETQLSSPDKNRNTAHHSSALQLAQIFPLTAKWLTVGGVFTLLLPYYRENAALGIAGENGFFCQKLVRVRQTPRHEFFRVILFLGRQRTENQTVEIVIRDVNNEYTADFQQLLKPFYLNL